MDKSEQERKAITLFRFDGHDPRDLEQGADESRLFVDRVNPDQPEYFICHEKTFPGATELLLDGEVFYIKKVEPCEMEELDIIFAEIDRLDSLAKT